MIAKRNLKLINKFNKNYIEFSENNNIYYIEITEKEKNNIQNNPINIDYIFNHYIDNIELYKLKHKLIKDYIFWTSDYSIFKVQLIVDNIAKYPDLFDELYNVLSTDKPIEKPIIIDEYTAQELMSDFNFSVIEAYTHMSNIRNVKG